MMVLSRISQFFPLARRGITSSLYATERNPKILLRTDLQFHKLIPTHDNKNELMTISKNWVLLAQERKRHSTDIKMREIFEHLAHQLDYFHRAVLFENLGIQGREVYLCRNKSTKEIGAVAFGREFYAGINICPHVICANPDQIPRSLQSINESPLEGPDSFLFRMIVKFGASFNYDYILLPSSKITSRGYKNIIFQSNDRSDDTIQDVFNDRIMDLKKLDFMIHGKHANRDEFRNI
jgi:hypothetical protein